VKSLEKAEKNLSADMTGNPKDEKRHKIIRFLENVSEFLDLDGNEVGPFEKGEIANLENEIADILINDKRAEFLEAS
jgi:hypothetical protein